MGGSLNGLILLHMSVLQTRATPHPASCCSCSQPHNVTVTGPPNRPIVHAPFRKQCNKPTEQEAQLSQTDRALLRVTEYFAKSLKISRGH